MKLCLQGKDWDSPEGNSVGKHCKNAVEGLAWHVCEALAPTAGNGGSTFSSKLFLRPYMSWIGLLTGTCTKRSETGWSLQYSNSKIVATCDADELKMLAWCCTCSCWWVTALVRPKSLSCRVASRCSSSCTTLPALRMAHWTTHTPGPV